MPNDDDTKRELHATNARMTAAIERIETLERAIPYGPEEPLGALLSSHRQRLDKLERELQRTERGTILEVAERVRKLEAALRGDNELREMIAALERRHVAVVDSVTERLRKLEQDGKGRDGVIAAQRQTLEELRGSTGTHLHNHLQRIAALEFKPHHRPRTEWDLDPSLGSPMVAHRGDGSERIVDAAIATMVDQAAIGNTSALVAKQLTNAITGKDEQIRRQAEMIRERDTAINSSRLCIDEQIAELRKLRIELQSAKESGQRAHDDSTQVRQALATATKERDNAYRAADKAKAQRDGVRSTVVDQARQIGELHAVRRGLESRLAIAEATAKTLTTQATEARGELSRRESDAMSAREQRLRESLGQATQLIEDTALHCHVAPLGDRATNMKHIRNHIELLERKVASAETESAAAVEALRVADADRVPLRMDLTEATKIKELQAPLVTAATRAVEAYRHEDNAMTLTSPTVSVFAALMTASDDYEKAMAEHLNEIPF